MLLIGNYQHDRKERQVTVQELWEGVATARKTLNEIRDLMNRLDKARYDMEELYGPSKMRSVVDALEEELRAAETAYLAMPDDWKPWKLA